MNTIISENTLALSPGTALHQRYIIEKMLGSGGFSITYTAWDKTLEMKTVVKEYMPKGLLDREKGTTDIVLKYADYAQEFSNGIDGFLKEARVLARFTHQYGIAGVIDYFSENNTAYIVMPYCEGVTLTEYAAGKGGTLDYKECLALLLPVMKVLGEVHKEGVIHRDISPENILITDTGRAVLLDFGASESVAVIKGLAAENMPNALKHGYAPPEQYCVGGIQGPWTDVYAMAATIYHCVGGEVPEPAIQRLHKDGLIALRRTKKGIPIYVSDAVNKAMRLASGDRYQDMDALIHAMTSYRLPVSTTAIAKTAMAAAVLCIGLFGGYLIAESNASADAYADGAVTAETLDSSGGQGADESQEADELQEAAAAQESAEVQTQKPADKPTATDNTSAGLEQIDVVVFEDENLEAAIRQAVGKPDGDILAGDLSEITVLELDGKDIASLGGIEYCTQVGRLFLSNNFIEDISALSALENLTCLALGNNLISDISALENCTQLSEIDLCANSIEDISVLSRLVHLNWLDLNGNQIADVAPLKDLSKLRWLNIAGNNISDISCLAQLSAIEELTADGNDIEDVDAFTDHPTLQRLQW